jgi:hypothetical protein
MQDAGLLLLELGLGQHTRRQQLTKLLQLSKPITHIRRRSGCLRRTGGGGAAYSCAGQARTRQGPV